MPLKQKTKTLVRSDHSEVDVGWDIGELKDPVIHCCVVWGWGSHWLSSLCAVVKGQMRPGGE